MITKDNIRQLLPELGFKNSPNSMYEVLERHYNEAGATVSIDFANERFIYPSDIQADRKTSQDFSKPEFFVVFECVCRLLEIGYKPSKHKCIALGTIRDTSTFAQRSRRYY